MNLVSTFGASVEKQPEKIALYWGDRSYSYRQLWGETLLVHSQLHNRFKLKRGDRVGLWLKNCPEFIPSLFGILHAGAVAVPINNFFKPDEVNYILRDAGINVLVTDAELGAHLPALSAARPGLRLFKVEEIAGGVTSVERRVASEGSVSPVTRHLSPSDLAVF